MTDELEKEDYRSRSKDGRTGVFTRDRKLTFNNLISIIIIFKSSIQRELDSFFKALSKSDFKIREVTKGALSQARAKLNPWAFIRLNEVAVNTFYDRAEYYQWHGMRTLAVDGSRLVLPNHPSVIQEFGQHEFGPKADSKRSLAMVSMLYDVLNQVTIDAQIAPYASSESNLLVKHLDKVQKGDLLLLDRGYPSFWLLFLLKAKGVEFCVRLKDDWWLKVKDFAESAELERLVTFKLPKKDRRKLADYPEIYDIEITCRLIKVELPTGETEILCTSLTDIEKYPHEEFEPLYHYRWQEEEAYKLLKNRIEIENFSGKTAKAVKQDFHAKVFLMTLCATYAHPIEEKVIQEYKADQNRKHSQKINRTNAISMTQEIIIGVLIRKQFAKALEAFDHVVAQTREIIRPGRNNPRNKKPKKLYSMNYKRL
ncbi:MAG: IS4 family transposase [Bacteroidales bacterium]|nr:IS4 family transposase [Bacteroidales bacterium]